MGYRGAPVSEDYGGRGLDFMGYGLIVEEVGRGDSAMRTVVSVQTSLVCGSIERWGSEEQKQRWLPKLTSGESFGCFGLTEPDTGSDAANLRTRAEKIDGGWRINGGKMWISLGNVAEVALIFAQTDPSKKHKGLACFLVPTESDGFTTQEIHGKLGLRASDTAEIALDGVEVSDDALLGEVGDGFKGRDVGARLGPLLRRAGCVGIIEGCVQASVAYAKERKQFDVPIASFQLVQEMIAEMIVRRDAARMLVRRAGMLKDAGKPSTVETSIAKLYATESAVEAANLAIQVHGGSGYVDDYPVERYLRDARVTTLYEGTSQIQKLIIGRDATGSTRWSPPPRSRRLAPLVETRIEDHVASASQPPEARNALFARDDGGLSAQVERFRHRRRGPLHRDRGLRRGVRRRRRHRRPRRAPVPRRPLPPRRRVLAPGRRVPDAARRGGPPASRSAAAASWP